MIAAGAHCSRPAPGLGRKTASRVQAAVPRAVFTVLLLCALPQTARPDWREWELARARLHARKAVFAAANLPDSPQKDAVLEAERRALLTALTSLTGSDPPPLRPGWREEAYVCPSDDSAQPFMRYLPPTTGDVPRDGGPGPGARRPLLVYLHGYSPYLNLLNWALLPDALSVLAEAEGLAIAMPFGRSNTDFQGIGEQDVIRVIDEMHRRFGTDDRRVILSGNSMGGMGVWCIGARFAERFRGLLMISARGDFYEWRRIQADMLPGWRRALVDDAFPRTRLNRLADLPILAFHGKEDLLIELREARAIHDLARTHNPNARLVVLRGADHWIADQVFTLERTRDWIRNIVSASPATSRQPSLSLRPGQTPSRLQNAFLDPFAFVMPAGEPSDTAQPRLRQRAREWERFAKARPRLLRETDLTEEALETLNLFVFGEPEDSPLIRAAFEVANVEWTSTTLRLGNRLFPRTSHGLWLAVPNPRAPRRTLVIQCGIPWGPNLSDNHRYDLLPDILVYTERDDAFTRQTPEFLAGGYFDADAGIQWSD